MDICATEVFDIYTNFMKYEAKRHKNRVFENRHGICVNSFAIEITWPTSVVFLTRQMRD